MSSDKIRTAALSALLVCAVLISGSFIPADRSGSAAPTSGSISPCESPTEYSIRAFGDCIGIFVSGCDTPVKTISVDPKSLPADAQVLLQKGITVGSREELLLLIEDYIS